MDSTESKPGFFARLKQHHIYRVAAWYGASIAVLIQIVARAFPYFGWSTAVPAVIIILIAGFPVAIVLAWMMIKPADPASQTRWQRQHWRLGAVVTSVVIAAVVVSGIYAFRFSKHHAARVAAEQAVAQTIVAPAFDPPADTIVVLPFANLSNDPEQRHFSDGITEELTSALGQSTGLRVIAWETASTFHDPKQTASEVGRSLNVANILYGTIARVGDRVRVTVELVNAVSGYQLWSAHYDDSLENIFAVQDRISAAIADALKAKFTGARSRPTSNLRAHELYLKGWAAIDRQTATDTEAARKYFRQALQFDPNYADAWAGLAHVYVVLPYISALPSREADAKLRAAAQKALGLDPQNVSALVALGVADSNEGRIAQAMAEFEQALALDPSNVGAHVDYAPLLPLKAALAQTQEAVLLDPNHVAAWSNLAGFYLDLGNWPQVVTAAQTLNRLLPQHIDAAFYLAFAYTQTQRGEDAVKAFDLVQPATALDHQLVEAGRLTYQALLQPSLRPTALAALDTLRRANISPESQGNLLQLYLALGEKATTMRMLPGNCAAASGLCSDLAFNPVYAPLHSDPRFEKLAKQYTTTTLGTAPASASTH